MTAQYYNRVLNKLCYNTVMTAKHRSVNNVLWGVVAGRIRTGRGPDAARGPPVGQPCIKYFYER